MTRRVAAATILWAAACGASAGTQTTAATPANATATAPAPAPEPEPRDPDPYAHEPTGIVFPSEVDRLAREYTREFDDPRLGVGVGYNAEGGHIFTVYVYDLGLDRIPAGTSDLAHQAFDGAETDIHSYADQAGYSNVQRLDATTIALPEVGLEVLVGHYSFDIPPSDVVPEGGKATSWLLVTACADHFLKIRYTAPWNALDDARAVLDGFLARWSAVNEAVFSACASAS